MLATKNLKQKRSSKKLTYKFVRFFKITNKIETQTYRLLLFESYRIYNTFHISLLESYHLRECGEILNIFMQVFELIDNDKLWKIKEIIDKIRIREDVWYKIK